ncbi:MAG: hypothetical protein ACRCST_09410 [Turicibacter sp.]
MTETDLNIYLKYILEEELMMLQVYTKTKEQARSCNNEKMITRLVNAAKDSLNLHARNIDYLEHNVKNYGINRLEENKKRMYWMTQIQKELDILSYES